MLQHGSIKKDQMSLEDPCLSALAHWFERKNQVFETH